MRILSRCSDILVANIHALLDKAENPEAMIGQVIREMEEGLAVARGHAAMAIAAERRLNRELAEQRTSIEFWRTKARTAVAANRDDLARVALARKMELEISAAELATQTHAAALETSAQIRASLHALEINLSAALRKQRSLIARHRATQARRALGRAAGKRLGSGFSPGAKLQQWEQRLTDLEDVIAAETEVQGLGGPETTFATWETEAELDRELAALKEENARR
jgi:phage shock protein A